MLRSGFALGLVATLALACAPTIPQNTPVDQVYWLEQNWSDADRHWAHHASQGTATLPIPYQWFVSLEQPSLSFWGAPGSFSDPDYQRRFGFIPSPASARAPIPSEYGYPQTDPSPYRPKISGYAPEYNQNPDRLPVGFARLQAKDPTTDKEIDAVGFTCAACHTGHLEYKGTSIRIDGAPAITDLGKFREAMGVSLAYTKYVPGRFNRFADRVLGENASREEKAALKEDLGALIAKGQALQKLMATRGDDVEEGFARLDALTRIGNQVFFYGLIPAGGDGSGQIVNYRPMVAPVNFPHIWNTSWFDWVQYDASIMQPMIRNAGEALGVSAKVNLTKPEKDLYKSTVAVSEIFEIEYLLAGTHPLENLEFNGLRSPKWPEDILGKIDEKKADDGKKLYDRYCKNCHLPAVGSDEFWNSKKWIRLRGSEDRYLHVEAFPVEKIGTDPAQAKILRDREVEVPAHLGIPKPKVSPEGWLCSDGAEGKETKTKFAWALGVVVEKTAEKWYDEHNVPPARRKEMNGYRPNCLEDEVAYKARPLNGIWATAPFLHNGSIPDLYELLSPMEERSEAFYLGSRLFDPVRVGYETGELKGGFELDTLLAGNRNTGHEYTDTLGGTGRLGPRLSEEQRYALIEYLKSL